MLPVLLLGLIMGHESAAGRSNDPIRFTGCCDASASTPIDAHRFVVANDEDSKIRLYDLRRPGAPVGEFDFTSKLKPESDSGETDLEGAVRIGQRIYWIGSHSNKKNGGKPAPDRHRFFATDIKEAGKEVELKFVGFTDQLFKAMLKDADLEDLKLEKTAGKGPEEPGGFNIEGLGEGAEGRLLIALRSPVPHGRAVLVPLKSPDEAIAGSKPKFGKPIRVELGDGRGFRSIDRRPDGSYLVAAGAPDSRRVSGLCLWDGSAPKADLIDWSLPEGFNPEAVMIMPNGDEWILSDDGDDDVDGRECKKLDDAGRKRFFALKRPK